MKTTRLFVLVGIAVAVVGAMSLGCGGAPENDRNLGVTARCVDGTLQTECPYDCSLSGGVAETYIGCDQPK